MPPEHAVAESSKLQLPPDLVAELDRRGPAPRTDMRVEGWKPSLVARFFELLGGKRSR